MSTSLRIDRWLWFARFFKSRSLAAKTCVDRKVRVNGSVVAKSNHQVRTGDVLTFPQGREIRIVRVVELGTRRGPAAEAQALFEDLTEQTDDKGAASNYDSGQARRDDGAGRPTKADRREIMRFLGKE
tara:strand:- start:115 stop:498 length:384 start_codon:yes stop_codon:yes gene_type:complete